MRNLFFLGILVLATACATAPSPSSEVMTGADAAAVQGTPAAPTAPATPPPSVPTAEEAVRFVEQAESQLAALNVDVARAAWVAANFITEDTQSLSAKANERQIALGVELAKQAARFDQVSNLPADTRRKLDLLKLALTTPGPADPAKTGEMTRIAADMEATYGAGKYCPKPNECLDVNAVAQTMRTSRDPERLLDVWRGWHSISPPMRDKYTRFVQLMNEGARELGYPDAGVMWRSKYDMPPDAFEAEVDRLWGQVKPLYDSLH
ncbi:MAG TPA: M2 family metallopeptidase, partial [Thermoanaerobaculia bacterium]|nr:M2 family metallopeptidase [Thermoanaerobaculia bacterium]